MNTNCYIGTTIPPLESEPCDGKYTKTSCVFHQGIITYLDLGANSTLDQILTKIVLSLQSKDSQIQELQAQIDLLTP
jgi:hypothetical protein